MRHLNINMRKYNNPDCCPCQSGCTKFCVTVVGYGDQVVSGLPLTYSGTKDGSPWTYDAVTDSEGKYCYTVTGTEKPKSVTVHGDCDSGAVFYYDPGGVDTCSVTFTYCSFRIVFSVNPEAAPTITSLPNLFATETRNEAGDEVTWSWCQLSTGFANTYPKSVTFTATTYDARGVNYGPNPLYPPLCKSLTINCGHDYTLDLVQSYFGDCYYGFNSCDKGCDKGVGPYQRGLISKTMEVRFSSIDNRFAADEGSWISLPGSLIYNTAGVPTGVSWDSGARGAQNHFQSADFNCGYALYGCYLNNPAPYERMRISYVGTNIQLFSNLIIYRRISGTDNNARCSNTTPPFCNTLNGNSCGCFWDSDTGLLCRDCVTSANLSGVGCSPTDIVCGEWLSSNGYTYSFSMSASDYPAFAAGKTILWNCEIRDAAC
jgi:hypothetical protein